MFKTREILEAKNKLILEKDMTIARLEYKLEKTSYKLKKSRLKAKELEKNLKQYEYIDEEEKALLSKLRKETLKAEIQAIQIDKEKEAIDSFAVKPKKFSVDK